MEFSNFISKWKQFNPIKIAVESINDDDVIEANQNSLEQGIRPDGKEFEPYSEVTLEIKRANGGFISQSGRIALKDTGSFFDSMRVVKKDTFAEITATDSKTSMLVGGYGEEILDVPESEKQPILDKSRPNYIENCKKFLGL